MIRLLFFLLTILRTNQDIRASQLYTIDHEKLPLVKAFLEDIPQKYANFKEEFLNADQEAYRREIDREKVLLQRAKTFCFTLRKEGIPLKVSAVHDLSGLKELMSEHFVNYFPDDTSNKIDNFENGIEELELKLEDYGAQYEEYVAKYGKFRDWRFRVIIDKLLNITGEAKKPLSLKQDHEILSHLESLGFVNLNFSLSNKWQYHPGDQVKRYLKIYPQVERLILGCGHHLSSVVTDFLSLPREGFCAACNLTAFHDGDLTISLQSNDLCDVVADMHDERLWEGIKLKSWKVIADHSWGESFKQKNTLKAIYKSLSQDGVFEVWSLAKEDYQGAYQVGFKLSEEIKDKDLVLFKK